MADQDKREVLLQALEAEAPKHGIDIVELELAGATKSPIVRVYIDELEQSGINLDEVTKHTKWISDLLEELDPFPGSYELEVSSPGIDRPLRRAKDFKAQIGNTVVLQTNAYEGRKKWTGTLLSADDTNFSLDTDEGEKSFGYDEIKKAHLKAEIDFSAAKQKGK